MTHDSMVGTHSCHMCRRSHTVLYTARFGRLAANGPSMRSTELPQCAALVRQGPPESRQPGTVKLDREPVVHGSQDRVDYS